MEGTQMITVHAVTVDEAEKALGIPYQAWAGRCHEISLGFIRSGLVPGGRVARGWCKGVPAQHSWAVAGDDCYDRSTTIIDPTLNHWLGAPERGIWRGTLAAGLHHPHGEGSIWDYGRPGAPQGEPVKLTPHTPLTLQARMFLKLLGPLDRRGWAQLVHSPVRGWPAAEIIAAIDDTKELQALIPVDILGMVTGRNPGGLYR